MPRSPLSARDDSCNVFKMAVLLVLNAAISPEINAQNAITAIVPITKGKATLSQKLGRRRDGQATMGKPQRCCIVLFRPLLARFAWRGV